MCCKLRSVLVHVYTAAGQFGSVYACKQRVPQHGDRPAKCVFNTLCLIYGEGRETKQTIFYFSSVIGKEIKKNLGGQ